ncbi:AAA family ATPase, partial [Flavobacteriaceae bacterium]|nr:AAA family ATPase [Flavobacteriaceae bacterium]
TGKFRTHFLLETLRSLQTELENKNISLIVENRSAATGIPFWLDQLKATALFFQEEWTFEEKMISDAVVNQISNDINVYSHYDQFLYHPEDVSMEIQSIPKVFTEFRKKCEKFSNIRPCFSAPKVLNKSSLLSETPAMPVLEDFEFTPFTHHANSAFPFKGGMVSGLDHLQNYFWNTKRLSYYKQTRNGLVGVGYSSKFSPWLANGYNVFEEFSRTIIEEGKAKGKANFFLSDPHEFSERLFLGRKEQFETANTLKVEPTKPYVFFDRGIHDTYAYLNALGEASTYWEELVGAFKYDLVFLLEPWESIYKSDAQRMETFDEAQLYFSFIKKIYFQDHPVVFVPNVSIEERVSFILEYLNDWNG